MSHQILQTFQIHACIGHVGAEGMPQNMGRDPRKRHDVLLVVLITDPLYHMLNVHGNLGFSVGVRVAVFVDTVLALAFAGPQDTAFAIFAFGCILFSFIVLLSMRSGARYDKAIVP